MNVNELPRVCSYRGRDNEPCYGKVDEYYDEKENKWVDYCEGHQGVPYGGFYIPQDPIRRWIFSQQNQKIREQKSEIDMLWEMVKLADNKLQVLDVGEIELPQSRLDVLEHDTYNRIDFIDKRMITYENWRKKRLGYITELL